MRLLSVFLAALALTNIMADDSFCVKYAKAITGKTTITGADEYGLISAVVARVVVGCDNNAAGQFGIPANLTGTIFANYGKQACGNNGITKVNGLVNDPLNAPFFAGTAPNYNSVTGLQTLNTNANPSIPLNPPTFPSIRFVGVSGTNVTANPATTGNANSEGLVQHLVSFFGNALGCSSYNATTNTPATFPPSFIGKYNGVTNMLSVHQNMNITASVWNEFINTFNQTLLSFGVQSADVTNVVVPIVSTFLLGPNQICNDKATCACAPINGQPANNVNGTCVATTAAPGTTTAPPTGTSAPTGTGGVTTSPPTTKGSASTVSISAATIFAAVLLAFL